MPSIHPTPAEARDEFRKRLASLLDELPYIPTSLADEVAGTIVDGVLSLAGAHVMPAIDRIAAMHGDQFSPAALEIVGWLRDFFRA